MTSGFQWPDYVVFVIILLVSLSIGLFSAILSKDKGVIVEYLLGSRRLKWLPVGLSIIVTFQSAILFIGVPAEVYSYGHSYMYFHIGMGLAVTISGLVFVPLLFPLRLTSVYEYLERRFESKTVRIIGSILGMINMCLYMGVVLFAPATAIEVVSDFPAWMSVLLMGVIATLYTSLGGLRAVVWTDVFQFLIMVIGLLTIFIQGCLAEGGLAAVWEISGKGGRLDSVSLSADPRVRHSLWALSIGGTLTWLSNVGVNQANVQRFSSVPSVNWAKLSVLISGPGCVIFGMIASLVGLIIYAHFATQGCDPIKENVIKNQNQLMPLYIVTVFRDYPGFPGMFVASLFCASLSTVSSSINSLAAIMWEDLFKWKFPDVSERHSTKILKVFVVFFGLVAMGVAFLAMQLGGPATQIALAFFGASGGPLLGMFLLGALCRRANWIGVSVGAVVSLTICMWLVLGKNMISPSSKLPGPPGNSCHVTSQSNGSVVYSIISDRNHSDVDMVTPTLEIMSQNVTGNDTVYSDSNDGYSILEEFYSISYLWISTIGISTVMLLGILISLVTESPGVVSDELLIHIPCCRKAKAYSVNGDMNEDIGPVNGDTEKPIKLKPLLEESQRR